MSENSGKPKNEPKFQKVVDSRGRVIEGLWQRNGRYYLQTRVPGKSGCRRIPLLDENQQPVRTVQAAQAARVELLSGKRRGVLPGPRITPVFSEYFLHYIRWLEETSAKSPLTIKKERSALKGWARFLGDVRIGQITRKQINDYALQRKRSGSNNRTVNLDVIALRNLLSFAKDEGWVKHGMPTDSWKPLEYTAPRRQLIPDDAVDRLVAAATAVDELGNPKHRNGQQFADFIKLLAYSGTRRTAGMRARWSNVDFQNKQITFRTKFDKTVVVDFNPKLEAHLQDMLGRRKSESVDFLFPSPQPGEVEENVVSPDKLFNAIREESGLEKMTLHDLRHWFTSHAIMSGIDTMTVAAWLGHSDGGVLIGKVYGHLNPQHRRAAAQKLQLGTPAKVESPALESRLLESKIDLSKISAAELLSLLRSVQSPVGTKAETLPGTAQA